MQNSSLNTISILVNKEPVTIHAGASVTELLAQLGRCGEGLALAIGEQIVPRSQWEDHQINEGDVFSLFSAIAGG